jgi:hypothetical protein
VSDRRTEGKGSRTVRILTLAEKRLVAKRPPLERSCATNTAHTRRRRVGKGYSGPGNARSVDNSAPDAAGAHASMLISSSVFLPHSNGRSRCCPSFFFIFVSSPLRVRSQSHKCEVVRCTVSPPSVARRVLGGTCRCSCHTVGGQPQRWD